MNVSTLETAWQKQIVTGGDLPPKLVAARMICEVTIARRRIRGGIVLAAFVLLTGWAVTIVCHITSIKPWTLVGLVSETIGSLLLVLFFVRAFRSARAVQVEIEMMGGTLQESVTATLRTVELQIQNARIAGYAIPAVVVIAAWLFLAKYSAGDIPGFGAAAAIALTAAFGALIGAATWHRHNRHLAPRRAELREVLQSLDEG